MQHFLRNLRGRESHKYHEQSTYRTNAERAEDDKRDYIIHIQIF